MQELRPSRDRVPGELQGGRQLSRVFSEHDVDRNQVGIEAIDARAKDQVRSNSTKKPVPASPQVVGGEPPNVIQEVGSRKFRNPMPGYLREVEIFHALAIDVNIEIVRDTRDPLDHGPLGAVALIEEWRDDNETRLHFLHKRFGPPDSRLTSAGPPRLSPQNRNRVLLMGCVEATAGACGLASTSGKRKRMPTNS